MSRLPTAAIVASIEQSPDYRLVRAFLLRFVDGETAFATSEVMEAMDARALVAELGLGRFPVRAPFELTPLGLAVAGLLRPKPWTADGVDLGWLLGPTGEAVGQVETHALAVRIASLLTADDLARAKCFHDPVA